MFDLNQALTEWRQQMSASGLTDPVVLDELESHLRDDIEEQMRGGTTTDQALIAAIERLGRPAALRREFHEAVAATPRTTDRPSRNQWWRIAAPTAGFFVAGAGLCCLVVVPLLIQTNAQYASWLGVRIPVMPADYLGLLCKLMFGAGAGLAFPMLLLKLSQAGVIDYHRLVRSRRYVIVFNLILGAVATTPEVVTQLLLFLPLQLSFEAGVGLVWLSQRKMAVRA